MVESQEHGPGRGRRVVVTGAAGGIGRAIARRLASDGWSVLAADVSDAESAPGITPIRLDVASSEAVRVLASELSVLGPLYGLVNVAGVLQDVHPLAATDELSMRQLWDINYFGAYRCLQEFAPLMTAGGSVVNITSVNEMRPLPLYGYAPAKVALGALTSTAAGELGARGIRVNAVAPGFTLTPTLAVKLREGTRDAGSLEASAALGRLVDPIEVAAAVAFLLGDEASAITGASLPVDAGWLAYSHWMDYGTYIQKASEPAGSQEG